MRAMRVARRVSMTLGFGVAMLACVVLLVSAPGSRAVPGCCTAQNAAIAFASGRLSPK
jgi:hypothetical protein